MRFLRAAPSPALLALACAAYDFVAEVEAPAQDHIMRERARRNMSDAVKQLSYDERCWLSKLAGR